MSVLDPGAAARLRRLGGEKLLREMIELFLQLGDARLAAAAAAGEEGERACHSLKSAAGNMGAHALQEAAARAERTAVAPDRAAHDVAVLELVAAYGPVADALRQVLEEMAA